MNIDYDGQEYDPKVQMDIYEYFLLFSENIDNSLKGSPNEKLLHDVWSGKLSNQIKCSVCQTVFDREEDFFSLSLEIKNKRNIVEALEYYVSGELLEGDNAYRCDNCDARVTASLHRSLKTLPNTLFIHLKRFDYVQMRKIKLNDRCEFPLELNLYPYTSENFSSPSDVPLQPKEYYEYKLSGVVVHNGGADSGHYYSIIKHRKKENYWLEFNDDIVRPFNLENLDDRCFGGMAESSLSASLLAVCEPEMKSWSAYVLIYERDPLPPPPSPSPSPLPVVRSAPTILSAFSWLFWSSSSNDSPSDNVNNNDDNNDNNNVDDDDRKRINGNGDQNFSLSDSLDEIIFDFEESFRKCRKIDENFDVLLSERHFDRVWSDNLLYFKKLLLLNADYVSFLLKLLKFLFPKGGKEIYNDLEFKALKIVTLYAFNILIHSDEVQSACELINEISFLLSTSSSASEWAINWINEEEERIKEILIDCPNERVRKSSLQLISLCICQPAQNNEHLVILLDRISSLWNILLANSSFTDEFLELVDLLLQSNVILPLRSYFVARDFILPLLDQRNALLKFSEKKRKGLFKLLVSLTKVCPDGIPILPVDLLVHRNFIEFLGEMGEVDDSSSFLSVYCPLSANNREVSEKIINNIVRCISLSSSENIEKWKRILPNFVLSKHDNLEIFRVELVVKLLLSEIAANSNYLNYVSTLSSFLDNLKKLSFVAQQIISNEAPKFHR